MSGIERGGFYVPKAVQALLARLAMQVLNLLAVTWFKTPEEG